MFAPSPFTLTTAVCTVLVLWGYTDYALEANLAESIAGSRTVLRD